MKTELQKKRKLKLKKKPDSGQWGTEPETAPSFLTESRFLKKREAYQRSGDKIEK